MSSAKDKAWLQCAVVISSLAKCHRLSVGCVLVDARSQVLSTGYNGRAAGLQNCGNGMGATRPCPNSKAPLGQPNGCESIHAEQNALLQCRDVRLIDTAYVSHSPCTTCVKLLLNTSCRRIVFRESYPAPEAQALWVAAGRMWEHWPEEG